MQRSILIFLLLFISKILSSQGFTWTRYTTEDGLASNVIDEIIQDEAGYLWIVNGGSISKFDGVHFTNYTDKTNFVAMRDMNSILPYGKKIHFTSTLAFGTLDPKTGDFKYFKNDSLLSYLYIPEKEAYRSFYIPLDKNGYRLLSRAHDKKENFNNDTLYFQEMGSMKYILFPKKYTKDWRFLKTDHYRNVWIYMYDSLKKEQVYFLFDKGELKFICSSPISYGQPIMDKQNNCWIVGDSAIYCYKNNKAICSYTYSPIRDFNGSMPVLDSKNNVWFSVKEGLLKFNVKGITLFKDHNRHIPEVIDTYYFNGIPHQNIKKDYNNFFNCIAVDKYDNIITGERIFDGQNFSNISFNKEFLSLFEGTKRESLPYLNQCFVDQESNLWYATSVGLFKASPIPFRQMDLCLSFDQQDYKLTLTGNHYNKLFCKTDLEKKKIKIKVLNGDTLKYEEELALTKTDYVGISGKDFLDGFVFTFSDQNDISNLYYIYGDKKIMLKSESKDSPFYYLCKDADHVYYYNKENIIVISRGSAKKIKNPDVISRLNNFASEAFGRVLLTNFKQVHFKNDGSIDTTVYLNLPGYSKKLMFRKNQNDPQKVLIYGDKKFFLTENKKVQELKYKMSDSILMLFEEGFSESFYFENSFVSCGYKIGYNLFTVDQKKGEIWYSGPLSYSKGLPSFYYNYFFYYNGKVIIYNEQLEYIKILTYKDFITGNLNDDFIVKTNIFLFDQESKTNIFNQQVIGNYLNFLGEKGYNDLKPKTIFTSLTYLDPDDKLQEFEPGSANFEFPYSIHDLKISFQGICLTDGQKLKYRTRLLGLNEKWDEQNSDYRFTLIPTLPAGSYTFQVKACNNNGIWNDVPAEISFTILPPWNRTWWAYTMYVVAGFAAIRGYLKKRTKKLEKEKEKLEKTVKERTAEVVEQKHLLEEKQKEIIDSITYAKRIQTSLMPTEKYISRILGKKK